jgi:cell division protein FtsW
MKQSTIPPARLDGLLLLAALSLVAFGLPMVFSASAVLAANQGHESTFFFRRQCLRAVIGLIAMVAAYKVGPERLRRFAPAILMAVGGLLLVLLIPWLRGSSVRGTFRWIQAFGLNLQPAEPAKLALVLHLSRVLARRGLAIATWHGLAAPLILLLVVAGLVALQPNLGTAMAIGLTGLGLFFAAGARVWHVGSVALLCALAALVRVQHVPYEAQRLHNFWHGADPQGAGYQLHQSLIALGSGGLLGQGLGDGMQKFLFLPDPHTDFIFAIVGEEGGFALAVLVLGAYALLIGRALAISAAQPHRFGALTAAGVGLMLAVHVLVNLAVVTGLAPTTGLPLPFMSYGGSSLVVNLAAVGILLRLSAERIPSRRPLAEEVTGAA